MKAKMFPFTIIISLILLSGLISCSVKYDEIVNVENTTPEFIFQDANLTRYEDMVPKNQVSAEVIEEYKNSPETFAKGVTFKSYDEKGNVDTEGECGYLYTNTKNELYELYDDIKLFSYTQNTKFFADSLRWNSKNEQLIGGKNDMVKIEKDDTVIYGSGFAASGVSKIYSFSGSVSGDIETE